MSTITDVFASKSFDKEKMKKLLSVEVYEKYKAAVRDLSPLELDTANEIAEAVKSWAVGEGATHYTHWFQPLTGLTAKKHESFLDKDGDGNPIISFSGKDLIKGEPDASSFPSGGLRSTFEARGYTYWDITSQMYIRDHVLYIPTIFVSFSGESLDKKLPLLKSISAVNANATKVLNLLGYDDVKATRPNIGLEQEYFLVDTKLFKQREDLVNCGKTLFGAMAAKGQEMEDHYFGSIPTRVQMFMQEVNQELWKLGIYAKTEHNEVAPSQFEIAPVYVDCNIGVDQNLQMMDILKSTALKYGLTCLLYEKPFAKVNGSGKHCNYSLNTNTGINCFKPGNNPAENKVFLLFTAAMIKAVDEFPELLRMAASGPGNDDRLGASEAPPAIVSIFLGSHLSGLLKAIADGESMTFKKADLAVLTNISDLPSDFSDRNRTSPMAFTGSKFEFRMVGSSRNPAMTNIVLNTILAKALKYIIGELETNGSSLEAVYQIVKKIHDQHSRIIFEGNGYSQQWVSEAKLRGLPNIKTYYESLACMSSEKVINLFSEFNVLTATELLSRQHIYYEMLNHTRLIEGRTMARMLHQRLIPDLIAQTAVYSEKALLLDNMALTRLAEGLNKQLSMIIDYSEALDDKLVKAQNMSDAIHLGKYIQVTLKPLMNKLRVLVDDCEVLMDNGVYQLPSYYDLFLSIK
jgi:glutamine synthetase